MKSQTVKSLTLSASTIISVLYLLGSATSAEARTPFVVTGARSHSWSNVRSFYTPYQPNVATATRRYGFYAPWAVQKPYGTTMLGTPWQRAACAAGACALPSDFRLKRDITLLGRLDNGIGLYRFRYKTDDQLYVGVMAQEVALTKPEAVVRRTDGYFLVDYAQLGLHMATWEDWKLAHCATRSSNTHACYL